MDRKLIKELNCNKNLDNLKIAELYKLQFGKAKLKQAVLQSFPKTPDVAGTLHKELVNLNPHYIITTNWDKLIDDAIEKTTNIYDIIVNDNELVKSVNNSKYIKMHGDFEHDNFLLWGCLMYCRMFSSILVLYTLCASKFSPL